MTRTGLFRTGCACVVAVCLVFVLSGTVVGVSGGTVAELPVGSSAESPATSGAVTGSIPADESRERSNGSASQQPASGNHTILVTDNETGAPIAGATIEGDGEAIGITDLWGVATVSEPPETVSVYKKGYVSNQSVELTGRHTSVALDPAGTKTALRELTVLLYNQKTQAPLRDGYQITMDELELGTETYDVPEEFSEYESFRDRLDDLARDDANGEWAAAVVRLLDGETLTRQTSMPTNPPGAKLRDETPADELYVPAGTYTVTSQTTRFEDKGKQFSVNSTTIVDFTLEPKTGTVEFTIEPQTTDGTATDVDLGEFAVEIIRRNDDGEIIKRDSFTPDRSLTHHGELTVEGNTVTISEYPAGEYDLTVDAQGFETAEITGVTIPENGEMNLGSVPFETNATNLRVDVVSSVYTDSEGPLDLRGAPVSIEGQTGAATGYTEQKQTAQNGSVEFEQIPNGQYDVTVGRTNVTADGVTAVFKPQSLVMNLGAEGLTGGTPDPDTPGLGEYRVAAGGDHTLVANLMPTAGVVRGEVRGNRSAQLWPIVTWPGSEHPFPESFRQGPVGDATIEFEATFDGHELNTETPLVDDTDLTWQTTPLGVVYGDLPPGEYDLTIDKNGAEGGPPGFKRRTIEGVAVNSSGTSILSPDEHPTDRSTADPIHLQRDGDYVFGQLRMDVFSENSGLYRSTDHWGLPAEYPSQFLTPYGGPGYYGPISDATLEFSSDNRTVTVQTNESGQFDLGYLQGGDWEVTVSDTPYALATDGFDLELDGNGALVGLTLVAQAESAELKPMHGCDDGSNEFDCPPVILTITNPDSRSSLLLREPRGGELPTTGGYNIHHDDKTEDTKDPWFVESDVTGEFALSITDQTKETETETRDASLEGYVYDEATWEPIAGAEISVDGEQIDTTNDQGYYSGTAETEIAHDPAVNVTVVVSHETVTDQSLRKVQLTPGDNRFDPYVERDAGDVVGTITDTTGEAIEGVRVSYEGNKSTGASGNVTYTDESGQFRFNLEVGTEENATFRFEHPELYPAKGTFDLDVSKDQAQAIPADSAIRINRTPAPEITDIEYHWAESVDGSDQLPSDTHVLSRIGTKEDLTEVAMTASVNRLPADAPVPSFGPAGALESDFGTHESYEEWLRSADDIAETEPGNVTFDHTGSSWVTESRFDRESATETAYNLTATVDLSQVPVTHTQSTNTPVAVNVSVRTERGQTARHDRTLGDGGTDQTNIYVNEPPRPLNAVIGDRSAGTTAFAVFSSSPGGVKFNGTDLDGAYPEVGIGTDFQGKMERNTTEDGDGPSAPEYSYKMGLDLTFKLIEDLSNSSQTLDTFLSAAPSTFKTEEVVTVKNEAVESSVETNVGGSSKALKAWIESWSWAGGINITEPKYEIGYKSADTYGLAPSDRGNESTWQVDGSLKTGVGADLVSVIPQLKPLSAAGVKAKVGTDGTVNTAVGGPRGDDGDAYFGPIDRGSLKPVVTAKLTLGVEPGVGPVSVSVAEAAIINKGSMNMVFKDSLKPTQIYWNGSITGKIDSLAYKTKLDIAGPGTIKQWDQTSESQVNIYRIERQDGIDQRYQDRSNYHRIPGNETGTLVEAAYPDSAPRVLAGGVGYIHDDTDGTYPASLGARVLDRGSEESRSLDVGGPPIALATNGENTIVASHLALEESYSAHPMSYLPDAGLSLVERGGSGWSEPVEISPAGGDTMDLYPELDSTADSHVVVWRRDASMNPTTSVDAELALATINRSDRVIESQQTLESDGVVAPADVSATEAGVAVLGAVVGPEQTALRLYQQRQDGWEATTVATGSDLDSDTAAVSVDPDTGQATYVWADRSTIHVETPTERVRTIETNQTVSNLELDRAENTAALVWTTGDGGVYSTRPTVTEPSTTVREPGASTQVRTLSMAVGESDADLVYGVVAVENETVIDRRGLDIAHATPPVRSGPPVIVDGRVPTDPDDDGVYEDVDGNGVLSIRDVSVLFEARNDPVVRQNVGYFDADGDGEFSLTDIRLLLAEVS